MKVQHTINCPYPEGCDCGATEYNHLQHDLRTLRDALQSAEQDRDEWRARACEMVNPIDYAMLSSAVQELINQVGRVVQEARHHQLPSGFTKKLKTLEIMTTGNQLQDLLTPAQKSATVTDKDKEK